MSKTKIEQYPNSLMTVSKILSKRNKKHLDSMDTPISDKERNDFYKNKEQYKTNVDEILNKINDIDIYIDELNTVITDIFINVSQPSGILRKIIQDLTFINKNYKNNIIKKSKYYNLYDLQEIETNFNVISNKYSTLSTSPKMVSYLQNNGALESLLNKATDSFNIIIKKIEQISQNQPLAKFEGGYLSSISDDLARYHN